MAENEDIPYNVSDTAIAEEETKTDDDDQPNKSVLLEVQKYLAEAVDTHNTIDVIDLTESAKMTPTQQIAVNKVVVGHLRTVKQIVDNKIKELV